MISPYKGCRYIPEVGVYVDCRLRWHVKALRFAAALWRHARAGFPRTPGAVLAARVKACEACPRLRPDRSCGVCGCGVGRKAAWARESCPLGKWPG